jgi:hypothetical protein
MSYKFSLAPYVWAGATISMRPVDLSAWRDQGSLELWIKGETGKEKYINLYLWDGTHLHTGVLLANYWEPGNTWQLLQIPLRDFADEGWYWDHQEQKKKTGKMDWHNIGILSFAIPPAMTPSPVVFYVGGAKIVHRYRTPKSRVGYLANTSLYDQTQARAPVVPTARNGKTFRWPQKYSAAVSLTYDDGITSQLNVAWPALKRHRLVGTFFLGGYLWFCPENLSRWLDLAQDGHELGGHSLHHPCERSQGFMPEGYASEDYTLDRMYTELAEMLQFFEGIGYTRESYSFAYPCGITWVGQDHRSYIPVVQHLFVAARGIQHTIAIPQTLDLYHVPACGGDNKTGEELIWWVQQAEAQGGWLVFYFHGMADEYLHVQPEAHETLLRYLGDRRDTIWTDTFASIAQYIADSRKN